MPDRGLSTTHSKKIFFKQIEKTQPKHYRVHAKATLFIIFKNFKTVVSEKNQNRPKRT
jgi:hypothetical protein